MALPAVRAAPHPATSLQLPGVRHVNAATCTPTHLVVATDEGLHRAPLDDLASSSIDYVAKGSVKAVAALDCGAVVLVEDRGGKVVVRVLHPRSFKPFGKEVEVTTDEEVLWARATGVNAVVVRFANSLRIYRFASGILGQTRQVTKVVAAGVGPDRVVWVADGKLHSASVSALLMTNTHTLPASFTEGPVEDMGGDVFAFADLGDEPCLVFRGYDETDEKTVDLGSLRGGRAGRSCIIRCAKSNAAVVYASGAGSWECMSLTESGWEVIGSLEDDAVNAFPVDFTLASCVVSEQLVGSAHVIAVSTDGKVCGAMLTNLDTTGIPEEEEEEWEDVDEAEEGEEEEEEE
eukprot:Sspe_Gene.97572::Locus_71127_Transcript_1_1_Confidence_1.000_Length_1100::g.97572::m.97572